MSDAVARWVEGVPAGWAELLAADPSSSPAQRPEVGEAFVAVSAAFTRRTLEVRCADELVGGLPVLIERRGPFEWLHAMPMLLPGGPVARPGRHTDVDAAMGRALAEFARDRGLVGGEWVVARPDGPQPEARALEFVSGETRVTDTGIVRLDGGLDAAWRRMERKHRQALQHALTRGFVFAEEPEALEDAFALHVAQGRAWHAHSALPLALSRRLLEPVGGAAARLFTLRRHGELLSATLALDGPHETFAWWSGTHASGRRLDAFTLLLWSVVEWAAAHGRRRVNLGASTGLAQVSAFKAALGAERVRHVVRWLDARHASPPARVLAWLQARRRTGRPRGESA